MYEIYREKVCYMFVLTTTSERKGDAAQSG